MIYTIKRGTSSVPLFTLLLLCGFNLPALFGQNKFNKKIVTLGWDYPTSTNFHEKQQTGAAQAFDGILYSTNKYIFECFQPHLYPDTFFKPVNKAYASKQPQPYAYAWLQSGTGGHWLNDNIWKMILINCRNFARSVRLSGARGCFLDPEYYGSDQMKNPWTYTKEKYPTKTFREIQEIVRNRGREFMNALQTHLLQTDFIFLWTTANLDNSKIGTTSSKQALLPSFILGIKDVKRSGNQLIDGNEYSYYYSSPSDFLNGEDKQKPVSDPITAVYQSEVDQTANAVFYDYHFRLSPLATWQEKIQKHLMHVKVGLATTKQYLWYYTEKTDKWKQDSEFILVAKELIKIKDEINLSLNSPTYRAHCFNEKYEYLPKSSLNYFESIYSHVDETLQLTFSQRNNGQITIYLDGKKIKTQAFQDKKSLTINQDINSGSLLLEIVFQDNEKVFAISRWQ